MYKDSKTFCLLAAAMTVLMSLPFLVPGMGWTALFGFVPLLCMERIASIHKTKHFWWWHYLCFVLWNAVTTWWVCEATVGGGIFAVVANALQMSLVFELFRWGKRRLGGVLPYILLAAAWIAWEKYYVTIAEISWPWLVLGNAFADTTALVQWYEYTGHLGGSLWIWASNLAIFGIMVSLADGSFARWNAKAKAAASAGAVLAVFGPMLWSVLIPSEPESEDKVRFAVVQPNFNPYQKFEEYTQKTQDSLFIALLDSVDEFVSEGPCLVIGPETFTSRYILEDVERNSTYRSFQEWLQTHPQSNILFGASSYSRTYSVSKPNILSYDMGETVIDGARKHIWYTSHNTAVIADSTGRHDTCHKGKLVVGTELTPYPKLFVPLENLLGGNLMGKCADQGSHASTLSFKAGDKEFKLGCAICYESIYGEYCTGYVKEGAELLTVITNDAWWGNTPGYRQHFNYSKLRAIETGRAVVRCGNTGISALIGPDGKVIKRTPWWEKATLTGEAPLRAEKTFYVRYGDIVGRISVFAFILLFSATLIRTVVLRGQGRDRRGHASARRPSRNSRTSK